MMLPPLRGGSDAALVLASDVARCVRREREGEGSDIRHLPIASQILGTNVVSALPRRRGSGGRTSAARRKLEKRGQAELQRSRWSDTVEGKYHARLMAQEQRATASEKARQQIDIEWAAVRATENAQMAERARSAQRHRTEDFRKIDSSALLNYVLNERDKQVDARNTEREPRLCAEMKRQERQELIDKCEAANIDAAERVRRVRSATTRVAKENRQLASARDKVRRAQEANLLLWLPPNSPPVMSPAAYLAKGSMKDLTRRSHGLADGEIGYFAPHTLTAAEKRAKERATSAANASVLSEIHQIRDSVALKRREVESLDVKLRSARSSQVAAMLAQQHEQKEQSDSMKVAERARRDDEQSAARVAFDEKQQERRRRQRQECDSYSLNMSMMQRHHREQMASTQKREERELAQRYDKEISDGRAARQQRVRAVGRELSDYAAGMMASQRAEDVSERARDAAFHEARRQSAREREMRVSEYRLRRMVIKD